MPSFADILADTFGKANASVQRAISKLAGGSSPAIARAALKLAAPDADDEAIASARSTAEKLITETLQSLSTDPSTGALGPVALGLASALTAALTLGEISSILNQRTVIRPLRAQARPETLGALDVITAWRRGTLDQAERDKRLNELGFDIDSQKSLLRISEFIPGPQDLIRFAVREVFTPELRQRFELDSGFEEVWAQAGKDFLAVGLSKETASLFWAAHWTLPSLQQGFEMLHRGLIKESDLDLLLRAQDVMPFWRKPLKGIAFTPFTRVDIRRMHKLDVLDDEGVVKSYKDIGYDKEKSALQLKFVKALNDNPTVDDETFSDREAKRKKDLTRADVLRLFRDGFIDEDLVKQALIGLGFSKNETTFLIDQAELQRDEANARRVISNLQKGFVKGVLDERRIRAHMVKLELPSKFIEEKVTSWKLERDTLVETPTKSEILRWFEDGKVTELAARKVLMARGIEETFVDIHIEENLPEKKGA